MLGEGRREGSTDRGRKRREKEGEGAKEERDQEEEERITTRGAAHFFIGMLPAWSFLWKR